MIELKIRHFKGSNIRPMDPRPNGIADQMLRVISQMKVTPAHYDTDRYTAKWHAQHGFEKWKSERKED